MRCINCARIIELALKNVGGISRVHVDYEFEEVHLTYDPLRVSVEDMNRAIADLNYKIGETKELPKVSKGR